ncbi:MAG: aminotransferase class I/II-fold pyridoxal phosphate-dependent enzyme [Acidimicrobiaceae bacterium]|nr:aminotransferase class I/II-fold pyridoxal phosphate-dependent enzyme [Acidimicrobiaceae bacterium]MCY4280104.1 aminotransferase class I/II-fold pyridoxal phosphate-dependent enzyme [Acidimicrobiaceae bacterium]
MSGEPAEGFIPPAHPYERLSSLKSQAAALGGGVVDCSIGTPCDPPPPQVIAALGSSGAESGYPTAAGSAAYREAAAGWLQRRFGASVDERTELAACIGSKEFVVSLPHYLKLRWPQRDTVLYPAVSYPSYAMGAVLAGCRGVPVAVDHRFCIDLDSISPGDRERALCLWVNSPGNPAGGLEDLAAAAQWGRRHRVPVVSDECYAEFTWQGPPRSIVEHGTEGVLALHSLSKRSNMAGVRAGFYAGDAELVDYLSECRKHAGFMVPGPVQAAAVAAWDDQDHVVEQAARYQRRLALLAEIAAAAGAQASLPAGAFYLWAVSPGGDAWAFADLLARRCGLVVSPGEFYTTGDPPSEHSGDAGELKGPDPRACVRIAAVQPASRLESALQRLASAAGE